MIAEICVGAGILLLVLLVFYLLFFTMPFRYVKRVHKDTVCINVIAKKSLKKVTIVADDITFERKRIRQGQTVEFDYPASKKPAKLIVELEEGHTKTVDL